MTGKELAEYCNNTKCDDCELKGNCKNFVRYMSEYTPCSLLRITNITDDLFKREF